MMLLLVTHHCGFGHERHIASVAFVRPFARVQTLMNGHRTELRERFATDIARVRPLTRVRAPVAA